MLLPSCRHALPCNRFWPRAETQLICPMWSRAQELKSCCSLLVWFPSLAMDPSSTEENANCLMPIERPLPYPLWCQGFLCSALSSSFVKIHNQNKNLGTLWRTRKEKLRTWRHWCYYHWSPRLGI
jgi:hypothetical protein